MSTIPHIRLTVVFVLRFFLAMIYEKVLEYQSKHNEGPMRYEMSTQANGQTTDPASQESTSGLY